MTVIPAHADADGDADPEVENSIGLWRQAGRTLTIGSAQFPPSTPQQHCTQCLGIGWMYGLRVYCVVRSRGVLASTWPHSRTLRTPRHEDPQSRFLKSLKSLRPRPSLHPLLFGTPRPVRHRWVTSVQPFRASISSLLGGCSTFWTIERTTWGPVAVLWHPVAAPMSRQRR